NAAVAQAFLKVVDRATRLEPVDCMPVAQVVEAERPKVNAIASSLAIHALHALREANRHALVGGPLCRGEDRGGADAGRVLEYVVAIERIEIDRSKLVALADDR